MTSDVVVPGIMDGAVGSQIWMYSHKNIADFKLNINGGCKSTFRTMCSKQKNQEHL